MKFRQLLAAGFLCTFASVAWAQSPSEFVVEDIKVEGLQRVALGAALTYIPVSVGDSLNAFRVSQLIRSLYSSTHFEKIEVVRDGGALVIKVTERPTIANIVFEGNDDIEDAQLQDSLDGSNVRVGEPLDRTILTSIENGLKDFFYSIGKYNADVTAIITPLPRNRVDLKMSFDEGDAADIRQINIVGNEVFTDQELLDQMELKFNTPWWDFSSQTRYQKQTLEGDQEKLRSYYMDRGYLKYNVDSTQVSMTPDRDGLYITMNVNEGEQYTISGVELSGDLLGYEDTIEQILPLSSGVLYNLAQVTYAEEFISRYLGRFGYAYPTVTTIPDINDEDKTVKLTLAVDPGKRIYVRRVNFSGNHVTSDEVLRRDIIQMEGAWLSEPLLETSKARLARLTYIEEVDYETQRLAEQDDKVDVNVTVKEQPSGSFNAGIGFGDQTGLSLQAGVQQDNFLGSGKRVGFNVNTIRFQRSAAITYLDPYFTIDGISLGGNLSYSEFDGGNANLIQFNQKSWSIGGNLGYPIDEYNRVNFGLQYRTRELNQNQPFEQTNRFYELFVDPDDPDSAISFDSFLATLGWSRTTLNRGLFPTAGSQQQASFAITTPNSDVKYFRAQYDSRFYFPLSQNQRWSFLTRLSLGYGNGYGTRNGRDQLLPFTDNFRLGNNDLRGFENFTVGPRAVQRTSRFITGPDGNRIALGPEADSLRVFQTVGGNAMFQLSLELIVPTPFVDEGMDNQVRTSIFMDSGNVWDTEFDVEDFSDLPPAELAQLDDYSDPGRFRASAGISIQWLAPMGPMTFSFSRALAEEIGDEVDFFSFNIGQTF